MVGQAASRLGVTVREYRELEAGERWPNWETFHRICVLHGWPGRSWEGGAMPDWAWILAPVVLVLFDTADRAVGSPLNASSVQNRPSRSIGGGDE